MSSVLAVAATGLAWFPQLSHACSQPMPEESDPCDTLLLYAPAPAFPVALEDQLRIRNDYISAYGSHSGPSEDILELPEPFVIEQRTTDGWVSVGYDLVEQDDLVAGARRISLFDPAPGDYRIAWPSSTCGEPEVDTGGGHQIGEFTMTPQTEYPMELGTLDIDWGLETKTYNFGDSADCSPIDAEADVGVATISLTLSDAWRPWADASTIALYVDGELTRGFGAFETIAADAGVYTTTIETLCMTDEPEMFENIGFGPSSGTHTVELVGRVGDLAEVFSTAAEYTIDCGLGGDSGGVPGDSDGDTDGDGDTGPGGDTDGAGSGFTGSDGSEDGGGGADDNSESAGCSVADDRPAPSALLLLALLATRRRRRAAGLWSPKSPSST